MFWEAEGYEDFRSEGYGTKWKNWEPLPYTLAYVAVLSTLVLIKGEIRVPPPSM
jgi:hypothetical protein